MPKSPAYRILLGVFALILIAAVVGAIVFFVVSGIRNKPIEVKAYPGAQRVEQQKLDGQDYQRYVTDDDFEDVGNFYSDQDDMECEKIYQNVQRRRIRNLYAKTRSTLNVRLIIRGPIPPRWAVITIYPTLDDSGNVIDGPTTIDITRVWGD